MGINVSRRVQQRATRRLSYFQVQGCCFRRNSYGYWTIWTQSGRKLGALHYRKHGFIAVCEYYSFYITQGCALDGSSYYKRSNVKLAAEKAIGRAIDVLGIHMTALIKQQS